MATRAPNSTTPVTSFDDVNIVSTSGQPIYSGAGIGSAVSLLSNASATGSSTAAMAGGRYLWGAVGTFGGATLTLQSLASDGVTWRDVATLTASAEKEILVGQGDVLRVTVSGGAPSGLFSAIRRVN